jgi:hypothetical protein
MNTRWLIASYDGFLDDAKDDRLHAIFKAHGGTEEGSGYGIGDTWGTTQRDIDYYVPDANVAACKEALIAAGFKVRDRL